jgi:hypothetical protein
VCGRDTLLYKFSKNKYIRSIIYILTVVKCVLCGYFFLLQIYTTDNYTQKKGWWACVNKTASLVNRRILCGLLWLYETKVLYTEKICGGNIPLDLSASL